MGRTKGFSLVELAVALAIIALLLAGALIPLSTQIDVRNSADTRRSMESIREAIIGFAQANGRLPCPADGTVPAGGADAAGRPAGAEQLTPTTLPPPATAACTNSFGVVPWTTLGVPETDSWVPAPTQSSFALCSQGSFTVNTRNESTHVASAVGLVLPAVIISHGKNGYGAYSVNGSILAAPTGADETANATHTGAPAGVTTFYSRIPTPPASPCNDAAGPAFCEFDDIVVMISSNTLITRMVAAGKLP